MRKAILFLLTMILIPTIHGQDIYDINTIQEIKISFKEPNWNVILDSLKQLGNDERLVGEVTVNGTKYEDAGIRYKGNSSYYNVRKSGANKLPFNIKVNFKNKKQKLPGGFTTLKLSNIFRDPSFLREVLAYEIARNYMPAPRANFAKIYVNDAYLGLYNCTESVDDKFLENYFGNSQGTLVKCDPNWNAKEMGNCPKGDKASLMFLGEDSLCYTGLYELKSDSGWGDIVYLSKVLNKEPAKLESIMNIDLVLWMLAFNNVLVNLDSYTGRLCHNYYLYRDTFGIFHPVIWDMNLCFGGFRYTGLGSPLSNEKMQTLSPFIHYKQKNPKRPLITNLLSNPLYRKIYVAHVKTILQEQFINGTYLERAKEIQTLIDSHVAADENKLYPYENFQQNLTVSSKAGKSNIIGIEELMGKRSEYLSNHPLLKKEGPKIAKVEHLDYGSSVAINAEVEATEKVWLFYRNRKEGVFTRIEMFDDSGHNDQMEADGIWGATLENKKDLQYYIVAEGSKTATISPARASMEFYELQKVN